MRSEKLFNALSYAAVFCGFLSLWVSGTFGIVGTALFSIVMIAAWLLEGSRRQLSERLGTALIVLAIPVYYLLFRYHFFDFSSTETALPGILARLILSLAAIKLLQRKSDRDWMFLYLMSFFEVLLAAGLSISVLYLASFAAYIFVMVCTIILFEIRKTERQISEKTSAKTKPETSERLSGMPLRRVVFVATGLIVLIAAIATPMFFMLPRVGGAGIGGGSGGVATFSGFSDTVKLGGRGRIEQNDQVVMRVRVEGDSHVKLRWRGVALDTFDGQSWSKTRAATREPRSPNDRDLIQVDYALAQTGFTRQTVYLEPLDTPVLFGVYRIVGVQGNFPLLFRDAHGSVSFTRTGDRTSYKVLSDTEIPEEKRLRSDRSPYTAEFANYLQLPQKLDQRVFDLTASIVAGSTNRYDTARSIEGHLQNQFGYTLEQKASGTDPLADFLFNIREGHCEYFATAMAVMLRTQGIATRVVNGFQQGDYNDTADIYVVRQRNAHSWVEVYFPAENVWVPFDPTPFAGQGGETVSSGFGGQFRKYIEALETFWIQYFVAFDNQEQRSLFTSVRRGFTDYQVGVSAAFGDMQRAIADWWTEVRGDKGFAVSMTAAGIALLYLAGAILSLILIGWLARKIVKLKVWSYVWDRLFARRRASIVEFYDRMQRVLASKGLIRQPDQTPLEFAYAIDIPEAVRITEKYNRVRFGEKRLSRDESAEIEYLLEEISTAETQRRGE